MNEVSIIINGIRYDAVDDTNCMDCSFFDLCDYNSGICITLGIPLKIFKKSDKKFER